MGDERYLGESTPKLGFGFMRLPKLEDGAIDIVSVPVKSGLVSSRNEGRRAVEQGGVAVDGDKIPDISVTIPEEKFDGDGIVVRRGKKNFRKVSK